LVTRTTGIYWYDLFLDGELVTRMPFRITIEPQGEDDEFAETQGTTA
jgi:hypothetical protein